MSNQGSTPEPMDIDPPDAPPFRFVSTSAPAPGTAAPPQPQPPPQNQGSNTQASSAFGTAPPAAQSGTFPSSGIVFGRSPNVLHRAASLNDNTTANGSSGGTAPPTTPANQGPGVRDARMVRSEPRFARSRRTSIPTNVDASTASTMSAFSGSGPNPNSRASGYMEYEEASMQRRFEFALAQMDEADARRDKIDANENESCRRVRRYDLYTRFGYDNDYEEEEE